MKSFRETNSNKVLNSVTITFIVVVMLFFLESCGKPKIESTERILDRSMTPPLSAYAITTIVSDSGIIRYRISSNEWKVYDKADTPYWDFPKGLHFERFDKNYLVRSEERRVGKECT